MNPCELTLAITALANAIASNINDEELDVLSTAFTQLGDTLATIQAQRRLCESLKNKNQTNNSANSSNGSDASDDLGNSNGSGG